MFSAFTSQRHFFTCRDHALMRVYNCFMNYDIKKYTAFLQKIHNSCGQKYNRMRKNLI